MPKADVAFLLERDPRDLTFFWGELSSTHEHILEFQSATQKELSYQQGTNFCLFVLVSSEQGPDCSSCNEVVPMRVLEGLYNFETCRFSRTPLASRMWLTATE